MIGDNIKRIRELKELGVNELARKANVNASYVSAIEGNIKTNPSIKILEKIALALDSSVDEFFKSDELSEEKIKELSEGLVKESAYSLDKSKKVISELEMIPEEFTDPESARLYISKHRIFSSEGFNINTLSDDDILGFGNALLEQMKMVSYKYKNK